MSDFIVAAGLVLVIEGVLWAAFPRLAHRLVQLAAETPEGQLRTAGMIAVGVGVAIVWLVRG